jgi:hypothetical protein
MFFFFHLVTGIIVGLLIGDLLNDRRWILPCIIGAALPDIIDKPLNFLLLPAVNGDGRFLFHNLIIFAILLVAGLLLWNYRASPVIMALDIGILSHQVLDSMWLEPVRWLYPLLGPYPVQTTAPQENLLYLLATDLFNPSEWILIIVCICALFLYWYRISFIAAAVQHKKALGTLLKCAEVLLWVICGIVFLAGLLILSLQGRTEFRIDLFAITISVILLAVFLIRRWAAAFKTTDHAQENLEITCEHPVPSPWVAGFFMDIEGLSTKKKIIIASLIIIIVLLVVLSFPLFMGFLHKFLPVHSRLLR